METAKRILVIAPQPFFESRGTPLNVRAIVETLSNTGRYEVDLLVFPLGEDIECKNLRIVRSWRVPGIRRVPAGPSFQKVLLDCGLFCKAVKLARTTKYDVFHGIEEGAFIAALLGRLHKRPFVFDMDSCMETQLKESSIFGTSCAAKLFGFLERRSVAASAVVLTVCTALSKKVRSHSPSTKVVQIEDFPTEGAERGDPEVEARIRQELSLDGAEKVVVYTGNFERYQGIDLLLESVVETSQRIPMRLLLVGGGGPGESKFDAYVEKAKQLGIADCVHFCGNRPLDEMGSYMSVADCLVSPRIEGENTPLKLYSYMASNTPIVATNIYSHTQVLDSHTAFLGDSNPGSYARALFEAIDTAPGAQSQQLARAEAARKLVEQRYSRASFEKRLLALYAGLNEVDSAKDELRVVAQ